jgi:hypothetical protein
MSGLISGSLVGFTSGTFASTAALTSVQPSVLDADTGGACRCCGAGRCAWLGGAAVGGADGRDADCGVGCDDVRSAMIAA